MRRLKGIGVSPGIVTGRAVILRQRARVLRYQVAASGLEREIARLESSRDRTKAQLVEIRQRLTHGRGADLVSLFDAQLLMLDDAMLVPRACDLIREQGVDAEWAIQQAFEEIGTVFDEVADPYLRERKGDVADLVGRLRMNLRHGRVTPRDLLCDIQEASVLVADELTPSLAAQVDWTKVLGFATDAGSRTYHTAILARSLAVPAVVGLHDASARIPAGAVVALDGTDGELVLNPGPELIARAATTRGGRRRLTPRDDDGRRLALTADGVRIRLEANLEFPSDLAAARDAGAEGIGLFRSEFLLGRAGHGVISERAGEASEDAQCAVYRTLLEGMSPHPVTVRTFDVDEDQLARPMAQPADAWAPSAERGERQGLRGLRLSLARPDMFKTQLRALLRAARHGSLRILFPFVSAVDQVREARRAVADALAELAREGLSTPPVPIGAMIEIPAAAYTADLLAGEVDFFTIGTNDLIQYCLAVDRADERVSGLYEPLHPAILRVIVMVRRAAARRRIPVSLCGEMASDPALITLLVGLGLTDFSMTPGAIALARQVLAEVRLDELRTLARRVLRLSSTAEIEQELLGAINRLTRLTLTET